MILTKEELDLTLVHSAPASSAPLFHSAMRRPVSCQMGPTVKVPYAGLTLIDRLVKVSDEYSSYRGDRRPRFAKFLIFSQRHRKLVSNIPHTYPPNLILQCIQCSGDRLSLLCIGVPCSRLNPQLNPAGEVGDIVSDVLEGNPELTLGYQRHAMFPDGNDATQVEERKISFSWYFVTVFPV